MIAGNWARHDRVRGALHDAGLAVRDVVSVEPVVARLDDGQHRQQHGEVRLGRLTHDRDG
jgi:hypothetical protein